MSWEYLGKISPVIPLLNDISRHIEKIFGTGTKERVHGNVDHHRDVNRLVKMYQSDHLHQRHESRFSADGTHSDVLRGGCQVLAQTTHLMDWRNNREKYLHETTQLWDCDKNVDQGKEKEEAIQGSSLSSGPHSEADGIWESEGEGWEMESEGVGEVFGWVGRVHGDIDAPDMTMEWDLDVDRD